jgi:hypothetical protein
MSNGHHISDHQNTYHTQFYHISQMTNKGENLEIIGKELPWLHRVAIEIL